MTFQLRIVVNGRTSLTPFFHRICKRIDVSAYGKTVRLGFLTRTLQSPTPLYKDTDRTLRRCHLSPLAAAALHQFSVATVSSPPAAKLELSRRQALRPL